jgi:hypothetical protein
MTKNNLKVVKTDDKKEKELKEKSKSLEAAISQIDQNFGKGSVMRLGQQQALDVEAISTGSLSLDLALGIGGLPKGRIIEIYGPESSGKTTLALQVVAEAQKAGGICAFVDAEHAMDPVYAKKLGVKTEELLISQPDTGEQALEITFKYVFKWRLLQEKKLRITSKGKKTMTDKEIENFIMFYERLTKHMLKNLYRKSDAVINIDKKHRLKSIKFN